MLQFNAWSAIFLAPWPHNVLHHVSSTASCLRNSSNAHLYLAGASPRWAADLAGGTKQGGQILCGGLELAPNDASHRRCLHPQDASCIACSIPLSSCMGAAAYVNNIMLSLLSCVWTAGAAYVEPVPAKVLVLCSQGGWHTLLYAVCLICVAKSAIHVCSKACAF